MQIDQKTIDDVAARTGLPREVVEQVARALPLIAETFERVLKGMEALSSFRPPLDRAAAVLALVPSEHQHEVLRTMFMVALAGVELKAQCAGAAGGVPATGEKSTTLTRTRAEELAREVVRLNHGEDMSDVRDRVVDLLMRVASPDVSTVARLREELHVANDFLTRADRFRFCGGQVEVESRMAWPSTDRYWVVAHRSGFVLGTDGRWKSHVEVLRLTRDEALRRAAAIEACAAKHKNVPSDGKICDGVCPNCGLDGCVRGER